MKKIAYLLVVLAVAACQNEPKDYVTISGQITDKNSDSVVIRSRTYSKTIPVDENGSFSDTLKVETGTYNFYDGGESTSIFLKNGFDLVISLDTKMFDETVKYSGTGAEHSNFLAKKALLQEELLDLDALMAMDSISREEKFSSIENQLTEFYNSDQSIDTSIVNNSIKTIQPMLNSYRRYINEDIAMKRALPKGAASPVFTDYENFSGGTTSLTDLKGKYVYVDVWATWCGPCKAEIPSLKKVEKMYHDKNIAFVSLSIDDDRSHGGSWEQANKDWRKMVEEKELGGIQLFAPEGWKSDFVEAYKIRGIPRFILIDPEGNIVTPSAPRPSSDALIELFNEEQI
ncbi:TlpA disulfide reductase family protein [Lutimonas zeaxanthinifaciens]|uniref:TlpA disulfide reductase family protein n=1 Tax=Lutimonas zeaxanthinifaciens TaxID=3060215 RepID=UPI00265D233A|nr:TlpA disulfide reductase family protein [Lutimonas sp. YSD2104]WKK66141.1 TlpA disulfide reductase family protein [Lutimonas sp. YSD2104]